MFYTKKAVLALCRALRLDPSRVKSIAINVDHRGIDVTASMIVDEEMAEGVAEALEDGGQSST